MTICKKCGHDGIDPEHRWYIYKTADKDADLYCGKCNAFIRSWETG